jgi:hypothetical protein
MTSLVAVLILSFLAPFERQDSIAEKLDKLPDFEAAQIEKARTGEHDQLQQLACETDFGTATVKYHAIKKLGKVGGQFSVVLLSQFLEDKTTNTGASSDSYGTYAPLQYQALLVLPLVVPNPPVPLGRPWLGNDSEELGVWKAWLKENRDTVRKLEPGENGIIRSETACREILKHDLASTAYPGSKHPSKHGRHGRHI